MCDCASRRVRQDQDRPEDRNDHGHGSHDHRRGPSTDVGEAAIDAGMAELRRLDAMMSLYKDTSEITKVNLAAGKTPVKVSPEMIEVVEHAAEISRVSGGVFDVTIGPLVVLWQMRLKEGKVPTDTEIARISPLVNYQNIAIDKKASTIFLKKPGMIMDFGGMKGYMADRVADLFRKRGIDERHYCCCGRYLGIGAPGGRLTLEDRRAASAGA